MKNRYLLAATLGAVILALSSCEKDGGRSSSNGSRTASDNIPLASFATLYSYIGRTDIENIAQRFRDEGYTVNINYPEVEQGDQTGQIYAEKYYNSGNGSAHGYTLYFNLENIISRCRYKLYKAKARDEISNILGDQLQFCRNWTQTSFRASIWPEGANHIDFSTEEEFQAGLVEINGPTVHISSYTIYDNGFSLEIYCNDDVDLCYEIERQSSVQITFGGFVVPMGWFDATLDGEYAQIEAAATLRSKGSLENFALPYAQIMFTPEGIFNAYYSEHANRIVDNLCEWAYDEDLPKSFRLIGFDATGLTIAGVTATMTMYDFYAYVNDEAIIDEKELMIAATNITLTASK